MEADTRFNDTDLCWGPLRRVDAYRIYLVSGPAGPCHPGQLGGWNHLYSPGNAFLQKRRSAQLHTLAYYWGLGLGYKRDRVTETLAPECPGDQASVVCGLGLAFRSLPAPGR